MFWMLDRLLTAAGFATCAQGLGRVATNHRAAGQLAGRLHTLCRIWERQTANVMEAQTHNYTCMSQDMEQRTTKHILCASDMARDVNSFVL